jgi:hypothetical protein
MWRWLSGTYMGCASYVPTLASARLTSWPLIYYRRHALAQVWRCSTLSLFWSLVGTSPLIRNFAGFTVRKYFFLNLDYRFPYQSTVTAKLDWRPNSTWCLDGFLWSRALLPQRSEGRPPAWTYRKAFLTLWHIQTAVSRSEPPMSLLLILAFCQ